MLAQQLRMHLPLIDAVRCSILWQRLPLLTLIMWLLHVVALTGRCKSSVHCVRRPPRR